MTASWKLQVSVRVAMLIAAFWPVWLWYGERVIRGADEPLGGIAAVVALALVGIRMQRIRMHREDKGFGGDGPAIAGLLLYAITYAWLPPMFQGGIAMLTLALALYLSPVAYQRPLHVGLLGLLLLSLPLISSLQFYVGYPLGVASAEVSVWMLRLAGWWVTRDGVALTHEGVTLVVDAPCSGIRMLWVTGVMVGVLACAGTLSNRRIVAVGSVAFLLVIVGNGLRASALFFVDGGYAPTFLLRVPVDLHESVGLATLPWVLVPIALWMNRMEITSAGRLTS